MERDYNTIINEVFQRFPSFQKVGDRAYKPGIGSMLAFDALLSRPHTQYPTIHVAGTNGKGSVSTMLASALAAAGLRVGLYTSPHIFDFRERMRIIDGRKEGLAHRGGGSTHSEDVPFCGTSKNIKDGGEGKSGGVTVEYISEAEVLDFIERWRADMDRLDLSFFEITTAMAFHRFSTQNIDIAVIEAGLGGRLDSTNIITPLLSIVTNIGYDHCEYLGHTLPEIAAEKAGIFKREVPAIVGESSPETDQVFKSKSQEINGLPEPQTSKAVERSQLLLTFADKKEPSLWSRHNEILAAMDLQGCYQKHNLRTVLTALETLSKFATTTDKSHKTHNINAKIVENLRKFIIKDEKHLISAIEHSAARTDFHGRWEKLSERPYVIADIGHNSHGLKYNFAQLREMMAQGRIDKLYIIYGAMADKDVEEIVKLFPSEAVYYFVTVNNHRAMAAEDIMSLYLKAGGDPKKARCTTLNEAVREIKTADTNSLVYIGGSAYLVSEALPLFK